MYNELIIFFLIIIFIILINYDIKITIIFCIILYLFHQYSKFILNDKIDPFYYNERVDIILNDLKQYKNYDIQSYKLGLKYYNYFIKNIKLLKNINDYIKFISLLENSKIYLETSLRHLETLLFSININDNTHINNYNIIINSLKDTSYDIINQTEQYYDKIEKQYKMNKGENYNLFINNDPLINRFLNYIKPDIYNKITVNDNLFNRKYIS